MAELLSTRRTPRAPQLSALGWTHSSLGEARCPRLRRSQGLPIANGIREAPRSVRHPEQPAAAASARCPTTARLARRTDGARRRGETQPSEASRDSGTTSALRGGGPQAVTSACRRLEAVECALGVGAGGQGSRGLADLGFVGASGLAVAASIDVLASLLVGLGAARIVTTVGRPSVTRTVEQLSRLSDPIVAAATALLRSTAGWTVAPIARCGASPAPSPRRVAGPCPGVA